MFEGFPLESLGLLTPSALLGLCILAIITGRLIPLKTHERELQIRDRQITYLEQALKVSREVEQRQTGQIGELMEHSRVATAIIKSLPHAEEGVST